MEGMEGMEGREGSEGSGESGRKWRGYMVGNRAEKWGMREKMIFFVKKFVYVIKLL